MRFSTGLWIAVACVTNVALGWSNGYHAIGAYLTFWVLAALPVITASNIVRHRSGSIDATEDTVRIAVVSLAIVVGCGLLLGVLRVLTVGAYCCVEGALLAVSYAVRSAAPPALDQSGTREERFAVQAPVAGIAGALMAFAIAFAATHAPLTLYDSLSYHLFFAARWLQDHALSIVPTPFSDVAQAYAPANGELFFLWLMLPFHGDLLARFGQMPFALLAAATLYLLARRLGAPPEGAIYPSVFLIMSRPVLEQAVGANVDLICAALFLVSLYLGIVAVDLNRPSDWALWGVAVGLYGGTKYLALVYMPLLLVLAVARGVRANAVWALPGIAAFAVPWYARNWAIAGSPIYPASVAVGGFTLARGAFDHAAMLRTVFHTADAGLVPAIVAHGLGPALFLLWLPIAVVGGLSMLQHGWWPHAFVCVVPPLIVAFFWYGVPVNIDSRFLMPAIAPALLPFAFLFRDRRHAWNVGVHALLLAGMAWLIVGSSTEIPAPLPWFMSGWLSLDGLVSRPYLLGFGALAAVIAAGWHWQPRGRSWLAPTAACLVALPSTLLALGAQRWCQPAQCNSLSTTSPYVRADLITGWQWMTDHVRQSTVAYTGNNLPYPLAGPQLTNRVVYVNIDGRSHWKLHDYDRAYRAGRFNPVPPLLAVRSGELLPIEPQAGGSDQAIRPRYERMEGLRGAWLDDLRRMQVGCLFVAALSPYEIDYVWHDGDGFPIEAAWAGSDPGTFHLLYRNSQVRVYATDGIARWRG